MYKIFMLQYVNSNTHGHTLSYDPLIIYDDENSNPSQKLISPVLTLEDNTAGSLTFTMTEENVGYSLIRVLRSTLIVKRKIINPEPLGEEYETIWEGRVISESRDFYNQKTITCEGALAYLNDVYLLGWDILELHKNAIEHCPEYVSAQFKIIFELLLKNFNEPISGICYPQDSRPVGYTHNRHYDRRIFINKDDISEYLGDKELDFSSECESILSYIGKSILERFGGHVRVVKRAPTNGEGSEDMIPDPTDIPQTGINKALCFEYVEEYYTNGIAEFTTNAYSKGDHVIYNGGVYRFIQDHEAGADFDISEVEQVKGVKVCKIEFAKNLIDLTRDYDGTDVCTAVLVTGGPNGYFDPERKVYFTVHDDYPSLNPSEQQNNHWYRGNDSIATMTNHNFRANVNGFPIANAQFPLRFENDPDNFYFRISYIFNREAAFKYGLVAQHIDSNYRIVLHGDDEESYSLDFSGQKKIYEEGIEFLKMHNIDNYSIEVTALDFNFVDHNVDFANIGDLMYVDSEVHGMDESLYFILTKLVIPLDSPESTIFTLNKNVTKSASSIVGGESRYRRHDVGQFIEWTRTGPEDPDPDTPIPEPDPEPESEE